MLPACVKCAALPVAPRYLAGRRIEAMLVHAEAGSEDRQLIRAMLANWAVPVALTRAGLAATIVANWLWLAPPSSCPAT